MFRDMVASWWLRCALAVVVSLCVHHIDASKSKTKDVDVPMCNDEGKLPSIDSLTKLDLRRINSLEQLHVLSRHGSRVGDHSVLSVFPNMNTSLPNTKWQCNFTTVSARDYDDRNWISLQKNYVEDEQVTGGNCKDSQSIYKAVRQHELNAHLLREYYIDDNPYSLMTRKEFDQIIDDVFVHKKYTDNNTPFIKIITTDLERCLTSVSVFMTHLLQREYKKDFVTPMDRYLYVYTHDEKSDPYTPQKNAKCSNLNKWMKVVQAQSTDFQQWINSEDVQKFFDEYESEVGYNLRDRDAYKLCANIVWMYCGGINLIPNLISQPLFEKIHNFTLEYRKRLLHSGELSQRTTELATMPFAWILKTLITDFVKNQQGFTGSEHINGYLNAERAKLVFHSTRGISTLLFTEPLGLSNGIQPIYANVLNFEIYSRNKHDNYTSYDRLNAQKVEKDESGYSKYLFRVTNMGDFLPFPGCDDEYMNGQSTLCNLQVLIDRLSEYAMKMNEWEPMCKNITDRELALMKKTSVYNADNNGEDAISNYMQGGKTLPVAATQSITTASQYDHELWWYLLTGIIIGAAIMWLMDRRQFVCNMLRTHKYDTL